MSADLTVGVSMADCWVALAVVSLQRPSAGGGALQEGTGSAYCQHTVSRGPDQTYGVH